MKSCAGFTKAFPVHRRAAFTRCSGDCAGKAARSSMRGRPLRAPQENITALPGQDKKTGRTAGGMAAPLRCTGCVGGGIITGNVCYGKKQLEFVKFLNRLSNKGMKLILSTHSDTFASKVNNLYILSEYIAQNRDSDRIKKWGWKMKT